MTWIVDASIAVKWMVAEPLHDKARRLLADTDLLEAPDLLFPETTNTVWKKLRRGEVTAEQAGLALAAIARLIAVIHPSEGLAGRALEMARALGHPVYDCFYLACAERQGGILVTADTRLCAVVADGPFAALVRPLDQLDMPP